MQLHEIFSETFIKNSSAVDSINTNSGEGRGLKVASTDIVSPAVRWRELRVGRYRLTWSRYREVSRARAAVELDTMFDNYSNSSLVSRDLSQLINSSCHITANTTQVTIAHLPPRPTKYCISIYCCRSSMMWTRSPCRSGGSFSGASSSL